MKQTLLLFLLVFPVLAIAQQDDTSRRLLLGQVVRDSIAVENITIHNTGTRIDAVTDHLGKFSIYAREKDTLIFSGDAVVTQSMVIEASDFEFEVLKIRLQTAANPLKEVVVYAVKLTGDLESDSKKIKNKLYDPGIGNLPPMPKPFLEQTQLITTSPVLESQMQGFDFIRIGKSIARIFSKPKPKEKPLWQVPTMVTFAALAQQKFSYHFFTVTLKIKPEQIGLFLNYCDTDQVYAQQLLSPGKEFELTDYLIKKSAGFHQMVKE